nr:integrase, catalytic region, zinc finger, CCHC-type, peptidase aspartic, catalytic [Tanacetum cinerariifolium]
VYYVEGLGHNLFSVGQFCDFDLEVTLKKHSCYVHNTDGVELIKGSRGSNLYTISVEYMLKSSPIGLLSKASKNKSWLWHHYLNHLNFGTINDLARKDLVRGLPRWKFENDQLCSACQLGKSKKHTYKLKDENTNLEVLNTLHIDLCGPMRVRTINGKKYILVVVDDYSWFTWKRLLSLVTPKINLSITLVVTKPHRSCEDLGKLQPTADIRIFVGYAPSRKAYRIYNKRTRHTRPAPLFFRPGQISLGLVPNLVPVAPYVPPLDKDLEILFQLMFDEYLEPPCVERLVSPATAVPALVILAGRSTSIEDNPLALVDHDPFVNVFAPETSSEASTSGDVSLVKSTHVTQPHYHLRKWSKDHPLDNIIGNSSRPVSTRKQLVADALWCFYNSILSKVKPKNFKSAINEACWFQAMQDEIYEFDRLQV